MREFYLFMNDSNREDLESVKGYAMGNFDPTVFWTGKKYDGEVTQDVRLWLYQGQATDYLGNPLSWQIVSERFLDILQKWAMEHIQVLPVPIFADEESNENVDRYRLINVTRSINAVAEKGGEKTVNVQLLELDGSCIPSDAHLFRLGESPTLIFISHYVFTDMGGKGLKGIALLKKTTR